jgi:hypothetical protein
MVADCHSTRMETDCAAKTQNESHHRPEQIRASIFEGVILGPTGPDFTPTVVYSKSWPISVKETKMLSAREQTGAQVWVDARNAIRAVQGFSKVS